MPSPVKRFHEFRDPIHNFISLDRQERRLVDSPPFQRLRHIHQLALTSFVYPGASHTRFEHSLGVMHLAGAVFDVVTRSSNRNSYTDHIFPDETNLPQWRMMLRLAALCHDMGHLPFSHAAEHHLLPEGQDHESITLAIIDSDMLSDIWSDGAFTNKDVIKKLAVGKKKLKDAEFSDWEAILSEIITGDSFGVDRIDYLMRDSYHLGVSYGRFDYLKLIESMRILPRSTDEGASREPALGVDAGGVHSAEALLLSRNAMWGQVYLHHIRRIYDFHLINFMKSHYGINGYATDVDFHLGQTDAEVMSALRKAVKETDNTGYEAAAAILERKHFRRFYSDSPTDIDTTNKSLTSGALKLKEDQTNTSPAIFIYDKLIENFDASLTNFDYYVSKSKPNIFPVLMPDGRVEESISLSQILKNLPPISVSNLYVGPTICQPALEWLGKNRDKILQGTY